MGIVCGGFDDSIIHNPIFITSPEVKQNPELFRNYNVDGKFYVSAKAFSAEYGRSTTIYLHKDGQWRTTVMVEEEYSGLFDSKEEAAVALAVSTHQRSSLSAPH